MKRIKCKSTVSGTVAHKGSNLKNNKHKRAAAKRRNKKARAEKVARAGSKPNR